MELMDRRVYTRTPRGGCVSAGIHSILTLPLIRMGILQFPMLCLIHVDVSTYQINVHRIARAV
jgi:hypothetical protein